MSGIRIHDKKPRFARWLTMAQVAELMVEEGKEPPTPREVRVQLLKVQSRLGVKIMRKFGDTKQAPWYTTRALIARHAPEMLDTDSEAIAAVKALRTDVLEKLETVDSFARQTAREAHNGLRNVRARLRALEQKNMT